MYEYREIRKMLFYNYKDDCTFVSDPFPFEAVVSLTYIVGSLCKPIWMSPVSGDTFLIIRCTSLKFGWDASPTKLRIADSVVLICAPIDRILSRAKCLSV